MNHLLRELAPITDAAWQEIDEEATHQLTAFLAARKLVDFVGPHGWEHSARTLGRTEPLGSSPVEDVVASRRRVLPLVEPRAPFTLSRRDLADADRGASDLALDTLQKAARRIARLENVAVFRGWAEAGIVGIAEASPHDPVPLEADPSEYPRSVARAVEQLRCSGVDGPYGLALGPDAYTGVVETTEHGGYPTFDHLRHILDGPLVWAPGVEGAVVLSLRGGDFQLEIGQDLAVGYDSHDGDDVNLYLEESFTFRVVTEEAAVALSPAAAPRP
jgi:uncharacterized linocin/CFP29 family protein